MPAVDVYLVRHGETRENVLGIIQGQKDTLLNDMGRLQSQSAGELLRSIAFDTAFTSDLRRSSETAKIILNGRDEVPLCPTSLLRERFMGDLEGAPPGTRKDKTLWAKVEPHTKFLARCLNWWEQCILPLSKPSQTLVDSRQEVISVLAVTHGAYISTLLFSGLLDIKEYRVRGDVDFEAPIHNTSVTVVTIEDGGGFGQIQHFAYIQHLLRPGPVDNPDILEDEGQQTKEVEVDRA